MVAVPSERHSTGVDAAAITYKIIRSASKRISTTILCYHTITLMPAQLTAAAFCGKIFYIGECLSFDSNVPIHADPTLTDEELHECDVIVTDHQRNSLTTDLLSMLVRTFHIALPIGFVRRLAGLNQHSMTLDERKTSDTEHVLRYWFHIANTYSMLFVLEAVQERCEVEAWVEDISGAWRLYYDAVKVADRMDKDTKDRGLVVELHRHLRECKALVVAVLLLAQFPESE